MRPLFFGIKKEEASLFQRKSSEGAGKRGFEAYTLRFVTWRTPCSALVFHPTILTFQRRSS
jgi:hypothetical protein